MKYRIIKGKEKFFYAQRWENTYWYNLEGTISRNAKDTEQLLMDQISYPMVQDEIIKEMEF